MAMPRRCYMRSGIYAFGDLVRAEAWSGSVSDEWCGIGVRSHAAACMVPILEAGSIGRQKRLEPTTRSDRYVQRSLYEHRAGRLDRHAQAHTSPFQHNPRRTALPTRMRSETTEC